MSERSERRGRAPRSRRVKTTRRRWRWSPPLWSVAVLAALVSPVLATPDMASAQEATCSETFTYTGSPESYTVPGGTNSVVVDAFGAEGGDTSAPTGSPGKGGGVRSVLDVTPGDTLVVSVGQQGAPTSTSGGPGTFGGGGGTTAVAGTGGGASDVRQGGSSLSNRVVVAGGGGGSGHGEIGSHGGDGGHPAGTQGGDGPDHGDEGGHGGTQTAGGAPGTDGPSYVETAATAGSLGQGGNGGVGQGSYRYYYGGGGAGGGYYGGGGGKGGSGYLSPHSYADGGGGGGGSSFGPTGTVFETGVNTGHGEVTITAVGCTDPGDLIEEPGFRWASDVCDGGTNVVSGFFGGEYVKVRTAPDPDDPGTTMVCVAADDRDEHHLGGRVDVRAGLPGTPVATDDDVDACQGEDGNVTLLSGTVAGGQPVRLDVATVPGDDGDLVWVCTQLTDAVGARLVFSAADATGPSFEPDITEPHPFYTEEPWPVVGQPSAACDGVGQNGQENNRENHLVNARVGSTFLGLYNAQPGGDSDAHWVCYRAQTSPTEGEGGRIVADATPSSGSDATGCTWDVVTTGSPISAGLFLNWDPTQDPPPDSAKVCVTTNDVVFTTVTAEIETPGFEQDTA